MTAERKSTTKKTKAEDKATTGKRTATKKTKPATTTRRPSATGKRTATKTTARRTKATKPATAVATPAKPQRHMPTWVRNVLAAVVIVAFGAGFYMLCIRPYAYRWKPCYGMQGYGVCLPCGYEVHGLDLSHYQGRIDWDALAEHRDDHFPLRFVFIKATEGATHTDPRFADNFEQAQSHQFVRGAYHYFIPQTDADLQARHFIQTVSLEPGDLPPVLDVETTGRRPAKQLREAVRTWMDTVAAHYGVMPILYTSYKFKRRYLDTPEFDDYPYWIAHYYVDSVSYQRPWAFWQHTDVGRVDGIDEAVDLNVFNGSMDELLQLTLSHEP